LKDFSSENIRNIGLFSHGSAGKTTLAESMLYNCGSIERIGKVDDGNTTSDFNEDEKERKISIYTSLAPVVWKNTKINCLDTPGFIDFLGEVKGVLRVIEGAVLLLAAPSGVEVGLEKMWEFTEELNIPRILFVNKMDKENADFYKCVDLINEKLSNKAIPLQLPIGSSDKFKGIIDLIDQKAYTFEKGKQVAVEIPKEEMDRVKEYREKLIETICETDDELINKYLEEASIDEKELKQALLKGVSNAKIMPIMCGSAVENIGVVSLMDSIVNFINSPNKRTNITALNKKTNEETEVKCSETEPFSAFVFKTTADPYVGKLTFIRIFSGTLTPDTVVYNVNKEKEEKNCCFNGYER